ncbi:hypothetical protein MTO96_052124 [Rhipicephalus appendiculatus]
MQFLKRLLKSHKTPLAQLYNRLKERDREATPESHLDQENTNLRLLLRAVADLLPPENQLRSICLQAGKIPRTRRCNAVDWRAFRQQLQNVREDQDFLGLVAAAAQAVTIQSRVPENHPVPDHRHLNLRAAGRRAERRYLKAQCPEHRTLFNRVDAVCRRPTNRRRRQSWQVICHSLSQARGVSKAWRLLRSLVIGTAVRQPVLDVAIRLGITEQELAEQLADRFTALSAA